jgi:FkbM family methyltransferase
VNWWERVHFLHRAWRYRLKSEKFGVSFLRSRDLKGRTAVDIGANLGIYSYWMCRCVGEEGHVIGFEPQPELAAHLKNLRETFRLHRLEIAEVGLSSRESELTLRRPKAHWGGASFEAQWTDASTYDLLPVKVTTLDAYLENHAARPIAFVKCDVEGHEYHVFRGGQNILAKDRPDLLFECHHAEDPDCDVFSYLNVLDYEGYCFFRGGRAPVAEYRSLRSRIHRSALVDFVFAPKERSFGRTMS